MREEISEKAHENLERALEFILPILKDRGEFEKIG
jgi:hypothetical protein